MVLLSVSLYAQPEREPAGVSRSPAGGTSREPKSKEGGGSGAEGKSKQSGASQSVKDFVKEVTQINSVFGDGDNPTKDQKDAIIRQMETERIKAEAGNRKEDSRYLKEQIDRIKKTARKLEKQQQKLADENKTHEEKIEIEKKKHDEQVKKRAEIMKKIKLKF